MQQGFKSCFIIYGFLDFNSLPQQPTILVEPRKKQLDIIRPHIPKHVILIPKLLLPKTSNEEVLLFRDDNNNHFVKKEHFLREKCFTTSFSNIIKTWKIQNITNITFNINIDNIDEILNDLDSYNHIVSKLSIKQTIMFSPEVSILTNFSTSTHLDYIIFTHKNLSITLPKIGMFLVDKVPSTSVDDFKLLSQQYDIDVLNVTPPANNTFIYDFLIKTLSDIFKTDNEYDILIQFNPKFLSTGNNFKILYPLKDNTIYINKAYNIIYGTKNCMQMLLQILNSNYFLEYIKNLQLEKKTLFKALHKRFFFEYLSKVYTTHEI